MKKMFKVLKNLSAGLTWKMFRALMSKPLLLIPTVWATVESVVFSELNFSEAHGGQGVANAFRHAAWNLLIAKNCALFTSHEKAVDWAKFTTDLHEEYFPNEPFDHQMDLHNNHIGRSIYLELIQKNVKSKNEMIAFLKKKTKTAVGLEDEKEFQNYLNELVFLKSYGS